jgi:hypothetical protein
MLKASLVTSRRRIMPNHMRTPLVIACALSLALLPACGTNQSSSQTSDSGNSSEATSSSSTEDGSAKSYDLSKEVNHQGVSLKIDPTWNVYQHGEADWGFTIDEGNDRTCLAALRTALHGQTKTLDSAWSEYTNAGSSPITEKTWSSDGMDYNLGSWTNNGGSLSMMVSGYDPSTQKGFLLWVTYSPDAWSDDDARSMFGKLADTITWDADDTTVDYKDEWQKSQGSTTSSTTSSSSSTNEDSSSSENTASDSYGPGTLKVGVDIPAGEYKVTSTRSSGDGYWCIRNSSAADAQILKNDSFSGSSYVTVQDGQYLELSGCIATPAQ